MRRLPALAPLGAWLALVGPLGAQERAAGWPVQEAAEADTGPAIWVRPLASLLVPGVGQLLGKADRAVIYLATEAYLVGRALGTRGDARAAERRYRDLAWQVARHSFASQRRDTTFEYYETLEKFIESGAFDLDPGPGLEPEPDPSTYNGSVWRLARETFFANPDSVPDPSSEAFQRAIAFYRARAVGPEFRWSWRNAGLEHDLYREAISESDEAYRQASLYLGLVLANHLVAAVDAFVSERLARQAGRPVRVQGAVFPGGGGVVVSVAF